MGTLALLGGFLHPALAFGAALAAVPLLIHLLNRQRYRPMPWAAMRFVQAAWRRTRRRARLEELLLLVLRMAAVALLALAVARPFAGGDSPLAALTESRRDLVLVLDGSASTGWRGDARTVFDDIVDRARELVSGLDAGRGDRVRLVLAGDHPRLLSWRTPDEAFELLATLTGPTDEALDLGATLAEVLDYAEEDAQVNGRCTLEIRLLSDLQRASFAPRPAAEGEPGETSATDELLERLHALEGRVLVEDLGPAQPQPANLAVTALELGDERLSVDQPAELIVHLANFGPQARVGVRVTLSIDGRRLPSQIVDVEARGEQRVKFDVALGAAGEHVVVAQIDGDRLTLDDQRTLVAHVPPPVRVLLVDGEPAYEIDRDEVGYVGLVLATPLDDAPGGPPSPFRAEVVEPARLRSGELDLGDWDVIVLANVSSLDEATVTRLEERVAAGGALLVTAGDGMAASADALNRRLFRADGSGLLPAELGRAEPVADRRRDWWRVKDFDEDHPALRFFADERWRPLLTEVPIYTFLSSRPLEDARVLAQLDDQAGSPLLIERAYDRGKVFLWLTTIDPAWARVAESPRTLVPLVHELMRYAGTPAPPRRNIELGGVFVAEVESFPRSPLLQRPDGSRRPLAGAPVETAPGVWRLPPVEDTDRAGLYRIELGPGDALSFAVAADPAESDLERLDAGGVAALHPALVLVGRGGPTTREDPEEPAAQGELWRSLALACLVALVAESLWAAWLGRRRSAA